MAITNFPGSAGGGLPSHNFIDQVYVSSRVRRWVKSGPAGYYRALSGLGEPGFVFFLQTDNTLVQAPLGGVAELTLPFTEIRILTAAQDLVSLYKVAAKTTDSLTLTANYTTITSTGLYTFPTNGVGFADALLVGGGGAAYHHGGGGGGGGIIELTSIPMKVGGTFSATVGAPATSNGSNGGDTIFLNHTAKGGGAAGVDNNNGSNGPTGGGATTPSSATSRSGGIGDANVAQLVVDKSRDSWLATVGTSLTVPLPIQAADHRFTGSSWNGGNMNSGSGHTGGGGGGAAGNGGSSSGTTPGQGGPGVQLTWGTVVTNKYFSAGGGGSNHNNQNDGPGGGTGWNNSAGHYGMGADSNHNSVTTGTGGIIYVRTWSV